jgi:hypothetical protein
MRPRLLLPAAACLLFAGTAHAAPSKEDVAKADGLFNQAQALVQKGQYSEGCTKFAESQKLDPANGTLLNLALCHEKEGKIATAYKELQELLALMSNSKKPDDRQRTRIASDRVKHLEKKVPQVTFDISELPKDATVIVDGEKVEAAYPVLLDPGKHVASVSAPQKKPNDTTFEVTGTTATVKLDALADDTPPPVAQPPPPPAPPPPPPPPPPEKYWSGQRILGAAIGGIGIAGLGIGTYFGVDTLSKKDERDASGNCTGEICNAAGLQLHEEAQTSAVISTIAIGVGAAALIAGAYLFFTAPSKKTVGANALFVF